MAPVRNTALTVALAILLLAVEPAAGEAREPKRPPNVVVIMTDDQTVEQLRVMEITQRRIGRQGVTFANSFVNWPVCCPSRATFLTGQYAHNHGVRGNMPPGGGFGRLRHRRTLPVWLQRRGYHTAHVGKYLNWYSVDDPTHVPPGWDEWYTAVGDPLREEEQLMYDYQLNQNGVVVSYGAEIADYKTDVFTDFAVDVIERRAPRAKPLFLAVMYNAPHTGGPNPNPQPPSRCDFDDTFIYMNPPKPAVRHAAAFADEPLPRPPSFDRVDPTHPPHIRNRPPLTAAEVEQITRSYRCELASLLAVDEGVGRIVGTLRRSGQLERTLVIFTSDNGFFHGELRIPSQKLMVYEPSIRVPLLVRGPGLPRGRTLQDLVVNADLAPTIVELAGAQPDLAMDGRSLLADSGRPDRRRGRAILIDTSDYKAVRTHRYVYSRLRTGVREMYDVIEDPHQLRNVLHDLERADARRALARLLRRLRRCSGKRCRKGPRVRLELRREAGPTPRCRRPLTVALRGRERGEVRVATLRVGGEPRGRLRAPAFERTLRARSVGTGRRARLRVTVELHDGRRTTFDRRVWVCR